MLAATAHFPNAIVWLPPMIDDKVYYPAKIRPVLGVHLVHNLTVKMGRVHNFSIDVQLELGVGSVANPHRSGPTVALQLGYLYLCQPSFSSKSVHDLQVSSPPNGTPFQPILESPGLIFVAQNRKGVECEGCIADPRKTVVPVARTANNLGQGRGDSSYKAT